MEKLSDNDFSPFVGEKFICHQQKDKAMILLEVSRIGSAPGQDQRCPFSLLFLSSPTDSPEQGLFSLRHDKLGLLDLFLVPIGTDPDGTLYEAVFN